MVLKRSVTKQSQRVFVGLTEISGFYGRTVDSLRNAGHEVSFWETVPHSFGYEANEPRIDYPYQDFLRPPRGSRWSLREACRRRFFGLHFFLWCVRRHDVFVFTYGQSFLKNNLDILCLRLLGKRVVAVVAHGSEIRPAFMDGAIWGLAQSTADPIRHVRRVTKRQRRLAARLELLAHDLIAHPMTAQFLRRQAIAFPFIGLPPPRPSHGNLLKPPPNYPIRIVHVPSDRAVKGSDEIARIVDAVAARHPGRIVYKEIYGIPNSGVLEMLQDVDLLIDQVYSDTIWAGVATEAASMGVPVLVGSRASTVLGSTVPKEMIPPAFVVLPDELEKMLEQLIMHPELLRKMGETAQSFVTEQWNGDAVAQRFHRAVLGNVPDDWRFNPLSIEHVYGGGLSIDSLRNICQSGHQRFGDGFFCLEHRPELLCHIKQLFLS